MLPSILEDDAKENEEVSDVISQYTIKYMCKESRRDNDQTQHVFVQEMLLRHPICCSDMFQMEKHVFDQFCNELVEHGLQITKRMEIQEMVAMFFNLLGHGVGNRRMQKL